MFKKVWFFGFLVAILVAGDVSAGTFLEDAWSFLGFKQRKVAVPAPVSENPCSGIESGGAIAVLAGQSLADIWGESHECLGRFPGMTLVTLGKFNGVVGEEIFNPLKINLVEIPVAPQIDSMNAAPVSEKKPKPKSKVVSGLWRWKHINASPFGNRSYIFGFAKAGVSQELIEKFTDSLEAGAYEPYTLKSGDTLLWMLSGSKTSGMKVEGLKEGGVLCDWPDSVFLPGILISIVHGDSLKRYMRPDICFNYLELPPMPIPPKLPEPEPVIPEPEPKPIPPPPPPPPEEPPIIAPPAPSLPIDHGPHVRADLWLGDDRMAGNKDFRYDFSRRGADFYGGKLDVYWQINKHFALGATGLLDGWSGESRSGYMYSGFEAAGGPMSIISFNPHIHWGLECVSGGQWEWGWISKYDAFTTNGFIRPGMTLDVIFDFWHFSSWGGFKLSFAEAKESYWDGVQFGTGFMRDDVDVAETRIGADGGCRLYLWQGAKVSPFMVYRGAWTKSDHARTHTVGGGIRFWDRRVALETSYKNRSHSKWEDSNGNALEMVLTISLGHGRGKPSEITPLVEVPKFIPDQDSSESVDDSIGKEADEDEWNEW